MADGHPFDRNGMATTAEAEAARQLRLEQARSTELQNELDTAKKTIRQLRQLPNARK